MLRENDRVKNNKQPENAFKWMYKEGAMYKFLSIKIVESKCIFNFCLYGTITDHTRCKI